MEKSAVEERAGAEAQKGDVEEEGEVIAGTRVGHGKAPLLLLIWFIFLLAWAAISWIPLFKY